MIRAAFADLFAEMRTGWRRVLNPTSEVVMKTANSKPILDNGQIRKQAQLVWKTLLEDKRFAKTARKKRLSADQMIARMMATKKSIVASSAKKTKHNILILWANVVLDVLMCLALVFNISLSKKERALERVVEETSFDLSDSEEELEAIVVDLQNRDRLKSIRGLIRLTEMIYQAYGASSLKSAVIAMLEDMKWYEKVLTAGEFIAWLGVIVASDGAAVYAKAACLVFALGVLLDDVIKLLKAMHKGRRRNDKMPRMVAGCAGFKKPAARLNY